MKASTVTALRPVTRSLDALLVDWRQAKADEEAANALRVEIERELLEHPEVRAALKEEGTVTVGPIKVTTGFTRAWDQERLAALHREIADAYWPFAAEWREDRKAARVVEERFPELWAQIRPALTLKPRKPTVSPAARN
jgi:hypothetical protein